MWTDELDARWHELAEEVLLGIKEWRLQHPTASLSEIEQAIDERWSKARARILQDAALVSAAANLLTAEERQRPAVPSVTLCWNRAARRCASSPPRGITPSP